MYSHLLESGILNVILSWTLLSQGSVGNIGFHHEIVRVVNRHSMCIEDGAYWETFYVAEAKKNKKPMKMNGNAILTWS